MNMYKLLLILLMPLISYSLLGQQNFNLSIKAEITGLEDTTEVKFMKLKQNKRKLITQKNAIPDKPLKIYTRIENAGFYQLSTGPENYMILITEPGEDIHIKVNKDNFSRPEVEGSPASKSFYNFLPKIMANKNAMDSLEKVYNKLTRSKKDVSKEQQQELINTYRETEQQQKTLIRELIKNNPGQLTGLMYIDQLSLKKHFDLLNIYAQTLYKKYPRNEFVEEFYRNIKHEAMTAVGNPAPDIGLPTPEGDTMHLSELKGKVVLIDFWASWCAPCRKENPEMVKIYRKYKDDGYDVFGVSLDKKRDAWIKAIKDDNLTWHHVSDLKGWKSTASQLYNVSSIPYTVLINKKGEIIAKGLRGESLQKKLKQIFGY